MQTFSIADWGTGFSSMVSSVLTIITDVFTFITSNWLLFGMIAVSVVIPLVFSVYQYFKNR